MAEYKLVLPAMGEGVMEATLNNWLKNEGDIINEDDSVIEISTDKVDSDVPSPVSGKLIKQLKKVNDIIKIGEPFAIIETDGITNSIPEVTNLIEEEKIEIIDSKPKESDVSNQPSDAELTILTKPLQDNTSALKTDKFLSPLVKSIIEQENILEEELNLIVGSGADNRITKQDVINYLDQRKKTNELTATLQIPAQTSTPPTPSPIQTTEKEAIIQTSPPPPQSDNIEIIEMDKMRRLISKHMLESKKTAPHATSFMEADVTNIVQWRNKNKDLFEKREGTKLTFMPIFVHALVKTLKDFPMVNISVSGDYIIRKKDINIGMATALPNGNLIVPVIKNADQLSIGGLAKKINDLALRARNNQLKPEEVQSGTYTITNIGTFGNLMGTPIINQPECAIMAVGAIIKKPAVIETENGDLIGIRQKMYCSHAFDHRVIDGALGGMFLQRFCEYLEKFDTNTEV